VDSVVADSRFAEYFGLKGESDPFFGALTLHEALAGGVEIDAAFPCIHSDRRVWNLDKGVLRRAEQGCQFRLLFPSKFDGERVLFHFPEVLSRVLF
jgi:hypothetical protein